MWHLRAIGVVAQNSVSMLQLQNNMHPKRVTRLSSPTPQSHLNSTNKREQNNDLFRREAGTAVGKCSHSRTPLAGTEDFSSERHFRCLLWVGEKFQRSSEKYESCVRLRVNQSLGVLEWGWVSCYISGFCFCRTEIYHTPSLFSRKQRLPALRKTQQVSSKRMHAHTRIHMHTSDRAIVPLKWTSPDNNGTKCQFTGVQITKITGLHCFPTEMKKLKHKVNSSTVYLQIIHSMLQTNKTKHVYRDR